MGEKESGSFGALLSRYRAAVGLSQEELAERAGLSVRGVSDLERGARTRPYATTVHQLAEALRLSSDDRVILEQAARRTKPVGTPAAPSSPVRGSFLGASPPGPLVGREEEMGRIRSALQVVAEGTGQLVLLVGELGIGKTRLAQEVTVQIRELENSSPMPAQFLLGTARCYQRNQETPYVPLFEALSEVTETTPPSVRSTLEPRWEKLRQDVDTIASSGTAGIDAQRTLRAMVTEYITALAAVAPIALLLDDLHDADDGTISLLQHLAHETRGTRLLLVATVRDTNLSEEHPLLAQALRDLARERLAERIIVRRLSAEETAELAASLMGGEPIGDDIATFLYRRTKGIPRFIEEMVRAFGGRLELQREIGAGAMGRVFAAYDAQTERQVAAKLMLARGEADLDTLLRFQHDAAVLSKLRHPGIVEIYDSFIDEHASCIIMELLPGRSLGQILQDGPLPLSRAKHLAGQVAAALSYAHTQQIVHRDIKPDNVMVLEGDQVKVTDFGIARILQPDTSLQTIATTGMRMGTPLYMAPEQIEGKTVDGRTDIYALGAMLYHMLTGRPPFEGSDALAAAVKHLQEEPVPPSQIDPSIPAVWDAVILKAMAKDPAKRFQSAQEMHETIDALGEDTAVQAAPLRLRWPLLGAAGVVALAVVLAVVLIHAASGSQRPGAVSSLDDYLAQHHFSGYILLERHGHVLLSKGYGFADAKARLPNTIRSKWPIPGTNRFMTAVAILRLQDQHKLSVHDTLCRYITGCPSAWRRITIHQLLLDSSGLATFDVTGTSGGVDQAIARCKSLSLVGAPGTATGESMCNNLLLNTVIVTVSGKPWAAAMKDLVFGPARMTDSGQLTNTFTAPQRVQGYSAGVPVQLGNFNGYYAPYSSVRDLERMDRALLSGHLLSRSGLRSLFTGYLSGDAMFGRYPGTQAANLVGCYECYLRQATPTAVAVVDNPGTFSGFAADDALSPDDGTIAIMVQNDESGPTPTDVLFGRAPHLFWGEQTSGPSPRRIAAYLTRARFSGYVYLERHGRVILSKGFGMADAEDTVRNTPQVKWPAFAESRFLVGLAIMKLQDQGKLSVHDQICRYVRGCPATWRHITIRELLTNTSGLPVYQALIGRRTIAQNLAACRSSLLVYAPGTAASPWSDCNTLLLDGILETVTGKSWADAMQQLVFGVAGMTSSGRMTNALKPPRRGRLYRAGSATPELNYDGFNLAYTTVGDVIRLNHALLAGTLLSKRSLDTIFAPLTPLMHDTPGDPSSPYRGYEVIVGLETPTTYGSICEACMNGGGEDSEGNDAGSFMEVGVSRESGSLAIVINNDSAYFNPGDNENAFDAFIGKSLYGK